MASLIRFLRQLFAKRETSVSAVEYCALGL